MVVSSTRNEITLDWSFSSERAINNFIASLIRPEGRPGSFSQSVDANLRTAVFSGIKPFTKYDASVTTVCYTEAGIIHWPCAVQHIFVVDGNF